MIILVCLYDNIIIVLIRFRQKMPLDIAGAARAVAIADAGLGYPRTTILDAIPRYRETGINTRRSGQGRRRCTSEREMIVTSSRTFFEIVSLRFL